MADDRPLIDIVLSPQLISAYEMPNAVAVVIDVLRASTTIITALEHGASAIYPLETVEEAEAFASKGKLVGAERNVVRCPFAQLGNDPFEYTPEMVKEQEIYFTTTNGTRTIKACMEAGYEVVIGSFINLSAIAKYCQNRNVLTVCAGWQGKPSKEDTLFATALIEQLPEHQIVTDVSQMLYEVYLQHKAELIPYIKDSNHYPRMVRAGKDNSFEFCLTPDQSNTVPRASWTPEHAIRLTI